MTTIAYRDSIIASESRVTEKDFIWTDKQKKIWRLDDGSLFGGAGDHEGCILLLEAVKKNKKKMPKDLEDTRGLHVWKDGSIWLFEGFVWHQWHEPYVSIGSGKKYAIAAMKAGANAIEAVKIATECDVYSGGKIQALSL